MEYIYGTGFDMGFRNFRISTRVDGFVECADCRHNLVVRILILISAATGFAFTQHIIKYI